MERMPPALAADDHPPSPPPPPTPAPVSEPPTPAELPSPLPQSPPPTVPPPRTVRRSARIRAESDRTADKPPSQLRTLLKRVSTDDTASDADNHASDIIREPQSEHTTGIIPLQQLHESHRDNHDNADDNADDHADDHASGDNPSTPQALPLDREDGKSSTPLPSPASHVEDTPVVDEAPDPGEHAPNTQTTPNVADTQTQMLEMGNPVKDTDDRDGDIALGDTVPDDPQGNGNDASEVPEPPVTAEHVSAPTVSGNDKSHSMDHPMNDEHETPPSPSVPRESQPSNSKGDITSSEHTHLPGKHGNGVTQKRSLLTPEKPTDDEHPMELDQPDKLAEEIPTPSDAAMEIQRPEQPVEPANHPPEPPEVVKETEEEAVVKKATTDSPPALTDSDDELHQNRDNVSKPLSPSPLSPPRTRRRLAIRTPSSPETPLGTSGAPIDTPKTLPPKSSRPSESSEEITPIEKPTSSRYETRSSTRGSSPVRTRQRRHSEPALTTAPVTKPRTRRTKKYSRKPVKGDRLRVLWHIDNIYYEGVVDSVLAFRGKRFYDITYDSGEREYYLELTHRKWRFADGRDGEDQDEDEEDDDYSMQRDIDYSKYPQIGDRIMVMWHVDGKYYPGKVNDILKANGAWFYDVDYEGGDREFFLDLTIRKWKYPETSEETAKHPLIDRKIPKPQPKSKPKPKVKPVKPKPKRVARKTIGPGSSSFAAGGSPSQSPPRPSRRQRTLEMLLDDQDDTLEPVFPQPDFADKTQVSRRDEVLDVLEEAQGFRKDKQALASGSRSPQKPEKTDREDDEQDLDDVNPGFDSVFDSLGGDEMDVLDEMEPPLPSQTILKRPRTSGASSARESAKPVATHDVSDIFSDLLQKPALPLPNSLSTPIPPPSSPKPLLLTQKKDDSLSQGVRPLPSLSSQTLPVPEPRPAQHSSSAPVRPTLKRKLAEQSFPVPIPKRHASEPGNEPSSTPQPVQRRLKTVEPISEEQEGRKDSNKPGDDPNVADIVSVAGIVAKKWAREEVGRISNGIDKLKKQISSLKSLHSRSLSNMRQKQSVVDPHSEVLSDKEAERQINNLGTNVVALIRKYRGTVEEREKKLKIQFTRMRTKITEQNEGLMETADVLTELDIVGLDALKGLQPKIRKKLEIPPPLPPRQASQAYTQPPAYALSSGVPMQQYQGSPSAPGTLGQHNDAIVRNLRRRLADLVTRSEWLGDEVKRLQGREKTLFREKSAALAELKKTKRTATVADLTANGKGLRAGGRSSLPVTKAGPAKPVGITKRRTRGTASVAAPPTPPLSKGSGKALRKNLPRSNSKYKAPPPEPPKPLSQNLSAPDTKPLTRKVQTRASTTVQASVSAPISVGDAKTVPMASLTRETGTNDSKARNVPSTLQLQMDKQASDLISLTCTVWLLQDESRSEPPNGAGERMDAWVRGCVKKCLNHALAFLTTSGGIFRARSHLKADVDNENIYTDWIMSAPTDDGAIERARGNYSLWDPSLRDSEWQAEKRVLRGLTICYQKALALTSAANFTATLMYAKAILNKAITDFEKFMPATITVLSGGPIAPPVARPSVTRTAVPIRPKSTSAFLPSNQNSTQGTVPAAKTAGTSTTQDKEKGSMDYKTISGEEPVASRAAASGSKTQDIPGSDKGIPVSAAPSVPTVSPAQTSDFSKPSTSADAPKIKGSASKEGTGQDKSSSQQARSKNQTASKSQLGTNMLPSGGSADLESPHPKSQAPGSTPVAPDSKIDSRHQPSKATATADVTLQNAEVSNTQRTSTQSEQLGTTKIGTKRLAEQAPTAQGEVTVSTPAMTIQAGDRPPNGTAETTVADQKPQAPGSQDISSSLRDNSGQRTNEQSSSRTNRGKSSSQEETAQVGRGKTTKATSHSAVKDATGSTPKDSQGSQAARPASNVAADTPPPPSQTQPSSVPKSSATLRQTKTTGQPETMQSQNAGLSTTASQSGSRGLRTSSKVPSRTQSRSQKKSKASRTQESQKKVHQTEPDIPVSQNPAVSTAVAQGVTLIPSSRLQEIPRKHMTLGAPRAPLELPRATAMPNQVANTGASGASAPAGTPSQRTYPMLSRNQVRVSTSAIQPTTMLSRNQVAAGKRPQVGTAQMSVPAAPQRRVAPGMQPSGMYGPSDGGDQMEINTGRDINRRRSKTGALSTEHHELEVRQGSGTIAVSDAAPLIHPPATGFPDESDSATGMYASNAPLNVLGSQQQGNAFQTTGKKKIGFKSLPMMPPRHPSHSGAVAGGASTLPQFGAHDRIQNSHEAQRTSSAPMEYTHTREGQTSDLYGQGGEPAFSPYNASGQERDLPVDLMNPPTPSSFAGLEGYGMSLSADQGPLPRGDSLPATPSDFDRYAVQSPINLERQSSWGTQQPQSHGLGQGQGQGQLGHIMNPQQQDGGYNHLPQRYQTRSSFQGQR